MAASEEPWFAVSGPLVNDYLIVLPTTFVGPGALSAAQVTAAGEHIRDVGARIASFDLVATFGEVAELGDLTPGDWCGFLVRFDGSAGPLAVTLDVRAGGRSARRLLVDVPADGGRPVVIEYLAP